VGIITRGDVLRLYARSDETIVAAVRDSLQAADGIVVEAVEQGVVRLAGTAESQAMASAVVRIAEAADGVVAADATAWSGARARSSSHGSPEIIWGATRYAGRCYTKRAAGRVGFRPVFDAYRRRTDNRRSYSSASISPAA
jgi:hypothetical protein